MAWQLMEKPYTRIIDFESNRPVFEIPVILKVTKIPGGAIRTPEFFKPKFFTAETSNQGYALLLRGSTGLKRILPQGLPDEKANFEDYDIITDYAIGALPKISDELCDSVKFGPWTNSLEGLVMISNEIRSRFDNLQIDIMSNFYRSITKWAFQILSQKEFKYILNKLDTIKEETFV